MRKRIHLDRVLYASVVYTVPRQPFDIDDLRAMARVMLDAAVS